MPPAPSRLVAQYGSRWELSWLPVAPLAGCLLCYHVAGMLNNSEREVGACVGQG
jgi:hypothetical protein